MSFRLPQTLSSDAAFDQIQHEVLGEKAAALGRAGKLVEERMAVLASAPAKGAARVEAVQQAADAVYALIIQRELCGLRNQDDALQLYGVTPEVTARIGARG
jgi:hypothetical protein